MSYRNRDLEEKRARDTEAHDWLGRQIREFKKDPSWYCFEIFFFVYLVGSSIFIVAAIYELLFGSLAFWRHP